jgi:hypothetical protein
MKSTSNKTSKLISDTKKIAQLLKQSMAKEKGTSEKYKRANEACWMLHNEVITLKKQLAKCEKKLTAKKK